MSRYMKVPNQKGIFKDRKTGSFYAVKHIEGKKYTKTFSKVISAKKWRNDFHPLAKKHSSESLDFIDPALLNGVQNYNFKQAWEKYKKIVFPTLQKSTIDVKLERSKFFNNLMSQKMNFMDPDFIDDYLISKKKEIQKTMKANRYNLNKELVELNAVFNWYRDNMDFKFVNPIIRKRHWPLGVIKKIEKKNKKITPEETLIFFSCLEGIFKDLAVLQFFIAGRIQEAAALQEDQIDFRNEVLTIDRAISWSNKTKAFSYLKETKTGKKRFCFITASMKRVIEKRMLLKHESCEFLFHIDGRALHYHEILKAYTKALRKAGLGHKYSGTHILRHGMAKTARIVTGSLDGTQAVTGHASLKMAEHYADLPEQMQIDAVTKVEKHLSLINSNAVF